MRGLESLHLDEIWYLPNFNSKMSQLQSTVKVKRRNDLQGIRAVAITAVSLFHFFPKTFPNGYLGVDQFFVLSGFLMMMISDRNEKFDCREIISFYYRRLKRILPSYLLVILLVLIYSYFNSPVHLLALNIQSAKYALSFTTNVAAISPAREYENMVNKAEDFFTHTWSIATEMQYYLIFPLLYLTYRSTCYWIGLIFLTIVGSVSLWYQVFLRHTAAFNLVHARIWQFCAGMLVYQLGRKIHYTYESNRIQHDASPRKFVDSSQSYIIYCICLFAFTVQNFCCYPFEQTFVRISTTFSTAIVILLHTERGYCILSAPVLVYIGDISYALYLIHWPVYVFIRQNYDEKVGFLFLGLLISVVLAVVFTELYERRVLLWEKRIMICLIFLLYTANISLVASSNAENFLESEKSWSKVLFTPVCTENQPLQKKTCVLPFSTTQITKDQAIQLNELHSYDDERQLWNPLCTYDGREPYGFCTLPPKNSTPAKTLLVIGNSYATNQAHIIYEMCANAQIKVDIFSMPACEAFATSPFWYCGGAYNEYINVTSAYKPDYLFLLFRHLTWMDTPKEKASTNDKLVENAVEVLKKIEANVKSRIFILDVLPRPIDGYLKIYHRRLRENKAVDQTLFLNTTTHFNFSRQRTRLLVERCSKCSIIDYVPLFTMNKIFNFVDEKTGVAYFNNNKHLTPYGLHRLRRLYLSICESL